MDFFVFSRTSRQTWPVCRAGAAPAGIATEKKMCYNRNMGIDCLLLLRKGELRSVEWKEMLQGIRERDPRAAKALFEEKGARLYHAFYLASGDYGAAPFPGQRGLFLPAPAHPAGPGGWGGPSPAGAVDGGPDQGAGRPPSPLCTCLSAGFRKPLKKVPLWPSAWPPFRSSPFPPKPSGC